MKKTFIYKEPIYVFTNLTNLFSVIGIIIVIVVHFRVLPMLEKVIDFIVFGFFMLGFFYVFAIVGLLVIRDWSNIAIFDDEKIHITGQRMFVVVQYAETIKYSDIADIEMVLRRGNSKCKGIKVFGKRAHGKSLFYEFTMKDGSIKLFYINPYSKKQRAQMLDIINSKTGMDISYQQLQSHIRTTVRKNGGKNSRKNISESADKQGNDKAE